MTAVNAVELSGVIAKIYAPVITPQGVTVARLILEHTSWQFEAGTNRQVACRLFCVWVGESVAPELVQCQVKVHGFLSCNAHKQVVLHITNLDHLD